MDFEAPKKYAQVTLIVYCTVSPAQLLQRDAVRCATYCIV